MYVVDDSVAFVKLTSHDQRSHLNIISLNVSSRNNHSPDFAGGTNRRTDGHTDRQSSAVTVAPMDGWLRLATAVLRSTPPNWRANESTGSGRPARGWKETRAGEKLLMSFYEIFSRIFS